jgi:hypothetical protein
MGPIAVGDTTTSSQTRALGTDEKVLYGQHRANKRNMHVNMHVGRLYELSLRLRVTPVVGSGERPLNLEILREALAEIIERLHVAVRPIYILVVMAEIDIRYEKYAIVIQEPRYFGELLRLEVSHIFEDALGDDDVETLVIELNWSLEEVGLDQIRRRALYSYVDTVVLDI